MQAKFISRFILAASVACGTATALEAASHYWMHTGTGSWYDPTMWMPGTVPAANDACFFQYQDTTGPVEVMYDGMNVTSAYVKVGEPSGGATSNDGTFEKTVYLRAGGMTHELLGSNYFTVNYRRKLVLDNLVQHGGTGNFSVQGKASVINGSDLHPDYYAEQQGNLGASYFTPGFAGSRFLLDNSTYHPYCFDPAAGGGKVIVRHNSYIIWDRSWTSQDKWAAVDFDFTTGTIITAPTYALYNYKMLPKRPGGKLICRHAGWTGTGFVTSGDTLVRLGGEAYFTNNLSSNPTSFSFTNSVTMYGRGKIFAQLPTTDDLSVTNCYDLSEISTRVNIQNQSATHPATYLGDTLFSAHGTYSTSLKLGGETRFVGAGTRTIDALEKFGRADKKRDVTISHLKSSAQAKIVIKDAKTASIKYERNDDTLGGLELGADVPLTLDQYVYCLRYQYEGLKMAAGSSIKTGTSDYNTPLVYGDAELDPTAKIIRQLSAKSAGATPVPLFLSYDDDVTAPTFDVGKTSAGFSVHRVGGSFYYGDDQYAPSLAAYSGEWTGVEDGLWSNTNNWSQNKRPNDSTTCFTAFRKTVATNDLDDCKCWRIINGSPNHSYTIAPFILRGKPITIGATDTQIRTFGAYPFILETDISYTKAGSLEVQARGDTMNATPIVLRGKVSVTNGSFSPDGQVVIQGGAVNAQDLRFRAWTGGAGNDNRAFWPTRLRVEKKGVVTISNQTTANSVKASFLVSADSTVGITGNWTCNTVENDNIVNGALNVSGALGGNATQGYYGMGVVKAGSLDGSDGASVRIGDGVTLATAGTTQMPVVMDRGDATIAATDDLTLAGGVRVDALGRTLTVSNDCAVSVTGALTGYDFDFVKKGAGRLQLAGAPGLTNGYVTVEKGTLAITQPTTMGKLTAAAGATLEFVADANGNIPLLTLNDNLDLTGLNIKLSGNLVGKWQTLATVGEDLEITGTPAANGIRVRAVKNADDTVTLQARKLNGMVVILN